MAARLLTPSSPIPPLQPFPLSLPTDNHRPGDCQPPPLAAAEYGTLPEWLPAAYCAANPGAYGCPRQGQP